MIDFMANKKSLSTMIYILIIVQIVSITRIGQSPIECLYILNNFFITISTQIIGNCCVCRFESESIYVALVPAFRRMEPSLVFMLVISSCHILTCTILLTNVISGFIYSDRGVIYMLGMIKNKCRIKTDV